MFLSCWWFALCLAIVTAYETNTQHDPNTNNAMLGVHASASAIIQYGKIARKQGLVNVALDILSRIHTIPTVPIVDCFQKIRQQVKCYLQLAGVMGKNECMQVSDRAGAIPSSSLSPGSGRCDPSFIPLRDEWLLPLRLGVDGVKTFPGWERLHSARGDG
ncbi:hypothetical protein JZ751_006510 [Albula glossodonta]|uniref:PIK-related kinase FAT domain-containing protein n=1 Tax=Albula glossodonta TaxID=121402 RepID=A0A8T2NAP7_9TELE|nr:hypothetical protein JZ751_006510 [Albula glossodonta]